MFLQLDRKPADAVAALDSDGQSLTYGELVAFCPRFHSAIGKRTLIFILSGNTIGSLAGYVGSLSSEIVPLLLGDTTDAALLSRLMDTYQPEFLWMKEADANEFSGEIVFSAYGYCLLKTGMTPYALHADLSLLLPTSGSTGSPKLVRHSYLNVEANARNVASFFELKATDRAMAILPMYYTMGLSVISSHLYAGATLLLTELNLTDGGFWKFIKEQQATSFTGVPYSYEILSKLRFFRMDLPHLELLTQGGGKLPENLFKDFADFAEKSGKRFIATYGQTEGTARMAYLPAHLATAKTASIGHAIPEGKLALLDANGNEITEAEVSGEMIYDGPNVTMGYALEGADLAKGDERQGRLHTGDIARRDADGCYYITGRMSRFLKLYGTRVSLDETEQLIRGAFDTDCMCNGTDERMKVHITNADIASEVLDFIVKKTGLFHKAFEIVPIAEIRRNQAGKIMY